MKIISPLNISKKVLALSFIGLSLLSPVNVLAVDQPVSAPVTIPITVPVIIPVPSPSLRTPEMIYPQNGQTLDLEGAYMFKVKPVAGAKGYLFGLFQDGQMIYENYRDTGRLSPDGAFTLRENDSNHAKFHSGPVTVMIRAYVNNRWTDAKTITINLKPRQILVPTPKPTPIIASSSASTQRLTATKTPIVTKPAKQVLPIWRRFFNTFFYRFFYR